MKSITTIGSSHPFPIRFRLVKSVEDDADDEWLAGIAREWHDGLADARQDIYTLADGVPLDEPR